MRSNLRKCKNLINLHIDSKSDPSYFGYPIILTENINREEFQIFLNNAKIDTRNLFAGNLTKQPYFEKLKYKVSSSLDNTDYIMKNVFWLGVHPSLTIDNIDYISKKIIEFLGEK